jgi:hypothetical protein
VLVEAFAILEKYGRNLLRPLIARPKVWKKVKFDNGIFKEKIDVIQVYN